MPFCYVSKHALLQEYVTVLIAAAKAALLEKGSRRERAGLFVDQALELCPENPDVLLLKVQILRSKVVKYLVTHTLCAVSVFYAFVSFCILNGIQHSDKLYLPASIPSLEQIIILEWVIFWHLAKIIVQAYLLRSRALFSQGGCIHTHVHVHVLINTRSRGQMAPHNLHMLSSAGC
jgi:hypothetical protein